MSISRMHLVLSLLVGLSDILTFVSVPVIIAALIIGHRQELCSASKLRWRIVVRWLGRIGVVLLTSCAALLVGNSAFGFGLDHLDYGLLTGVPTVFVVAFSAYTVLALAVLAGFAFLRGATKPDRA